MGDTRNVTLAGLGVHIRNWCCRRRSLAKTGLTQHGDSEHEDGYDIVVAKK
jgi:hypothetical protein